MLTIRVISEDERDGVEGEKLTVKLRFGHCSWAHYNIGVPLFYEWEVLLCIYIYIQGDGKHDDKICA